MAGAPVSRPLRGKLALVTGASSGLGRAMAIELAGRGCDLAIVARREQLLNELKDQVERERGVRVHVLAADLAREDAAAGIHAACTRDGLSVDILVNNAGFGLKGQFLELPWERQRDLMQVDVFAAVHLTRLFLPEMVERDWGRVMFVASTMAYQAAPGWATYAGAKGFLLLFGESLAHELRKTRVRVTVVSPGMVATPFHEGLGRPSRFQRVTAMTSEEVARAAVRAMLAGRTSPIIGTLNQAVIGSGRLVPRRVATAFAGLLTRDGDDTDSG